MNTFNSILLELLTIGGVGSLNYILVDLVGAADKAQVNCHVYIFVPFSLRGVRLFAIIC